MKIVLFFDLFYTLIKPEIHEGYNECDVIKMPYSEWLDLTEEVKLYEKRATGQVIKPQEIIHDMVKLAGLHVSRPDLMEMTQRRIQRFKKAILEVEESTVKALQQLKCGGYDLCLVSNADVIDVMFYHASILNDYFDNHVFSYEVGILKPAKGIYQEALKKMKVDPDQAYFIGDGGSDELKGAKAMGMTTVLLTRYIDRSQVIDMGDVDYVIDDINKLGDLL